MPEELGYDVKENHLLGVTAETEIGEFWAPLPTYSITDNSGAIVTDGYVRTGHVLTDGVNSYTIVVRGDGDGSGIIETYDYILARRVYFGTFTPSKAQLFALAITNGTEVTTYDYILIRRHFFGTVDLNRV